MNKRKRGFTLLELVVAVLIIALLAAVAVPMYKHAVLKSKFSTVMPPTQALAAAQEVFYLNNGDYAEEKESIDVTLPDTSQTTVTLSDKRNYKYVMGEHTGVPGAKYLVYQKRSKRFADNIHCEADKNNDQAKWLCEKGLGGTLITGSISGSNFLTYLVAGDAGTDKFIREDCAEGYYDNNGTCTKAQAGYYADEGERKMCEPGMYQPNTGATSCDPCPAGKFNDGRWPTGCVNCYKGSYADEEGLATCKSCPVGTYSSSTGATSCDPCPVGKASWNPGLPCQSCGAGSYADTEGSVRCKACPSGTYQPETGASSCIPCAPGTATVGSDRRGCYTCSNGYYAATEGSSSCTKCPNGQTSNADHTGCVPV